MKHPPRSGLLRRLLRERKGATAVEFALVGMPFLMLLMAITELSMIFLVSTGLDNATAMAAREIRTGNFQNGGAVDKAAFRSLVCQNLPPLPNPCEQNMYVDVETFNTFSDLAADMSQPSGAFDETKTCFSPGQARDIVKVYVYYRWPLITPLMNEAFADAGGGKRLLRSVAVFRNEPYDDAPPVGAKC